MRAAAALAIAVALPSAAQDRPYPWEWRVDGAHENLDNGYADWKEAATQLTWSPRRGLAVLGGARATERYDQRDNEGFGGFYLPLGSAGTTLHAEATGSSTHRVLARWTTLVEASQPLGHGFVLTGGGKFSRYAQSDVQMLNGTIEWYSGDYRLAYTGFISRPEGVGWAPAHRVAASWYRGTLTYVTLSLARGREVENVFPTGLLVTDVRAASLTAGLELTPQWGLTFEYAHVRQGDLYTRRTGRLGTRFLF